jgi:two-component system, cell cycle sensor histidine kinase and response regulator CckA
VVEETAHLVKVTLPPAVELQIQLNTTPAVLADATQVEQALLNLCTNAIQALGANKGTVRIVLDACHPGEKTCEQLGISPGSYVTLAVHDTGSGMSPQWVERIFEPFFTTKAVGQGTGLGLSVVHGIMQSHRGCVNVTSTEGVGSQFTLYFPVTYLAVAAPVEAAPKTVKTRVIDLGKRVMYVDDDAALVFLVERSLKRKGYAVSSFTDPHLAATALRDHPQDFDLLVTDYNMPGYSGVELLRIARIARPDLPVALASGYITQEIEDSALAEGARALIHKPNDIEELCATVQRLLQDERLD